MDCDLLNGKFSQPAIKNVCSFRQTIRFSDPIEEEFISLCERVTPFEHFRTLQKEFVTTDADNAGEFPLLNRDETFMYFMA